MQVKTFSALKARRPTRLRIRGLLKNRAEFSTHQLLSRRKRFNCLSLLRHELRTPLAGIQGMSELLRESGLAGEQLGLVLALQESGRQMESLIERMTANRPDWTYGHAITRAPINGLQFLEQVIRAHWPSAVKKGIGLHLVFDHRLPEIWHSDAACLRQLLDNLLSNAIKFTHRGFVLVDAHPKRLAHSGKDDIELCVSDTGIGITGLRDRRIYSAGVQGGEDVHRRYGGAGLGLFICERITALLGGSVRHQPGPAGGTCFRLVIPGMADTAANKPRRIRPSLLAGLRCRLELGAPFDRVVAEWLRRMGVQVNCVRNHDADQLPGGCDFSIVDSGDIAFPACETQAGQGKGRPVMLLPQFPQLIAGDADNPHQTSVLELPQPILMSNLEPLVLRFALQRALACKMQARGPGETMDSVAKRTRSGLAGDPGSRQG